MYTYKPGDICIIRGVNSTPEQNAYNGRECTILNFSPLDELQYLIQLDTGEHKLCVEAYLRFKPGQRAIDKIVGWKDAEAIGKLAAEVRREKGD